jgi:hypothetical protein
MLLRTSRYLMSIKVPQCPGYLVVAADRGIPILVHDFSVGVRPARSALQLLCARASLGYDYGGSSFLSVPEPVCCCLCIVRMRGKRSVYSALI